MRESGDGDRESIDNDSILKKDSVHPVLNEELFKKF